MEELKNEGNVDNDVLVVNDIPEASSLAGDESYKFFDVLQRTQTQKNLDQLLIIQKQIEANAAITNLKLLTAKDNQ
ncbi:hypothetical protein UF29_22765, partial [Vibrio parahaemolyticus]